MNTDKLCMGCMTEMQGDYTFCPKCGRKVDETNSARGLQPHTVLNGKYIIGRVLGEGGFGITYIAYDTVLNYRVAIKEYFPSELVSRDTSNGENTSLSVLTGSKEEQYKKGIERFIKEASNLAKFNNLSGIVSVKEFFYANNTAYMVMEYIDGISLSKHMEVNGGKIPYSKVLEMMTPVMDSLEKVHSAGIIHRDISPDNIMITKDGKIKLIDFGAARIVDNNDVKSLTVILKHGFAPEEQYHPDGHQGPWTDVYALSATMYQMITGIVPQESTDRILSKDKVVAVNKIVSDVPKKVSDAIMHGLSIKSSNRPQNISEFKKELQKGKVSKAPFIIIGGLAAMLILTVTIGAIVILGIFIFRTINNKNNELPIVVDNNIDDEEYSNKKDDTENEKKENIDNIENNDKTETEPEKETINDIIPEKETEDENTSKEDEELIKELTEEEKLAQWREYQNKILDVLNVSFVVPEEDYYYFDFDINGLYGSYDDFDSDGDYELFLLLVNGLVGTEDAWPDMFFADSEGVWMENEEGIFIKVTQNSDEAIDFGDLCKDLQDNYGGYTLYASDLNEKQQLGKQIICYFPESFYSSSFSRSYSYCYTVWNQEPKSYQGYIDSKENITLGTVYEGSKYYTTMGEEVICGLSDVYYSPFFLNGQFGELSSCVLSYEQYSSIPDMINQINIQAEYIKSNLNYVDVDTGDQYFESDTFSIENISIDSVLFNEAGYFILNYKCACMFNHIHSYGDSLDTPYYISLAEKDNQGEFYYSGEKKNKNTDAIEGLYAYVLLKYDGSNYELVNYGNGYIGSSVTDKVLLDSECPWIN